ncbi:unnamed protein product [Symbiodinium natans]|uniref:Uncharacterized protein n=1 Tax=Symbiodinium natans TaxID=878477 RepID=A0A812Q1B3_9DINO|nr:unnamed protein product [Symbiodinium natans]
MADISSEFHRSQEAPGRICLEAARKVLIGHVDLRPGSAVTEGYLWISDTASEAPEELAASSAIRFSGAGEISLDIGSSAAQLVVVQTIPATEVSVRLRAPCLASREDKLDDWAGQKQWLFCTMMALRRHLSQGATALITEFARPTFPVREVAIGLSHDHICWADQE